MPSTKNSMEQEQREKKNKNKNKNKNKSKPVAATNQSRIKKTPTKQHKRKIKNINDSSGSANGVEKVITFSYSSDSEEDTQHTEPQSEKTSTAKNGNKENLKIEKSDKKRKEKAKGDDGYVDGENGSMCKFPLARIKRIIESEEYDLQIPSDAVFLVNKATEKFLEKFCEEAYECFASDRRKSLAYKHLSSVVCKQRRFDFLSDFVPNKLKVEDALRERKMAEMGQG